MNMKKTLNLLCVFSVASAMAADGVAALQQPEIKAVAAEITPVAKESKEASKKIKIKKEYYVIIDAQKIIQDSGLDKEPTQELMALQQKYQKEIKEMADVVLKLEQDLKNKATTLTPDALNAKQVELNEENNKMQMKVNNANNQLRTADMNARTKVFQQLQQYTQETLIDKQGYKIVFERSGGIVAFAKGVDKTEDIAKVVKADMAKKAKAKEAAKTAVPKTEKTIKPVAAPKAK